MGNQTQKLRISWKIRIRGKRTKFYSTNLVSTTTNLMIFIDVGPFYVITNKISNKSKSRKWKKRFKRNLMRWRSTNKKSRKSRKIKRKWRNIRSQNLRRSWFKFTKIVLNKSSGWRFFDKFIMTGLFEFIYWPMDDCEFLCDKKYRIKFIAIIFHAILND